MRKACFPCFSRIWKRIEAVITGLTRNFGGICEFRPPDSPWYSSTQKISKSNIFCRLSCFLSNEFLSKFPERKPDENRHGELSEWSKVQHSKSYGELSVSSTKNLVTMRVLPGSKNWIICCSFRQFFPKPFSIGKRRGKTAAEHIGSGIEVVITGLTRNQVVLTGSWVRIPPAPPSKNPVTMRVSGFFFFLRLLRKSPGFGLFFP